MADHGGRTGHGQMGMTERTKANTYETKEQFDERMKGKEDK